MVVGLALLGAPWSPAGAQVGDPPQPQATSYLVMDGRTGEVLAAEDPDAALPMASLTKIMTALVVLERADPGDLYTVPPEALIGGTTAQLQAGETLSVGDLLTGLLVASGNDAAVTLAVGLAGSEEAFVALMNERARALGLGDTAFVNPHGFDAPGHVSTVRDLVRLSRVAMREPQFRERVAMRRAQIPGPGGEGTRFFESNNLLLDLLPDADGIKTGMTDDAGFALLAHARRPSLGVDLYVALIGATSTEGRTLDAQALLEWGFAQYARVLLLPPGAVMGEVPVQYRQGEAVTYRAQGGARPPIRLGEPVTEEIVAPLEIDGPVREGDVLGTVTFRQGGRVVARRDLVAAESAEAAGLLDRVRAGWGALLP